MQQDHVYQLMLQPNDSDAAGKEPDAATDQHLAQQRQQLLQQKKAVEKKK